MLPEASVLTRPVAHLIRRATGRDAGAIAELAAEHAEFERARAAPDARDLAEALDGPSPRLVVWLAEDEREILGYAAVTEDFSTWRAEAFLHLDCLFVRAPHRGRGLGAELFSHVQHHAKRRGIHTLEWQTPLWNADAIRFYERLGGRHATKARFSLSC